MWWWKPSLGAGDPNAKSEFNDAVFWTACVHACHATTCTEGWLHATADFCSAMDRMHGGLLQLIMTLPKPMLSNS